MSEKTARKFEKLRAEYEGAVAARQTAATKARSVQGLDGEAFTLAGLASKAGAKAVDAEILGLRDERRALKRLVEFAARHHDAAKATAAATKPAKPGKEVGGASTAKKAGRKAAGGKAAGGKSAGGKSAGGKSADAKPSDAKSQAAPEKA